MLHLMFLLSLKLPVNIVFQCNRMQGYNPMKGLNLIKKYFYSTQQKPYNMRIDPLNNISTLLSFLGSYNNTNDS